MFIKAFNESNKLKLEARSQVIIKAEICKELLRFFGMIDSDDMKEITTQTIMNLAELLKTHGQAVKKLHVAIINNSLNDSYNAYKERRHTGFGSLSEQPKLTDKIFQAIADTARINIECYSRVDFESVASSIGMIIAMLEEVVNDDLLKKE